MLVKYFRLLIHTTYSSSVCKPECVAFVSLIKKQRQRKQPDKCLHYSDHISCMYIMYLILSLFFSITMYLINFL